MHRLHHLHFALFFLLTSPVSFNQKAANVILNTAPKIQVYTQQKVVTVKKVAETSIVETAPIVTDPTLADTTVNNCGDNQYAHFIYEHESGCTLNDPNPDSGACGIGQAWPCSKLTDACPNLDYACENTFFNNYAITTYGSWQQAYNFWLSNSWW